MEMVNRNHVMLILRSNQRALSVGVATFLASWYLARTLSNRKRKYPPGLPSMPILGSLPWLPKEISHLTLLELSKEYGNIYTIDFGGQLVLTTWDLDYYYCASRTVLSHSPQFLIFLDAKAMVS